MHSLKVMICAAVLSIGTFSSYAADSTVYYPTYTDGSAHVYTYNPFQQFEINTQVGYVTDIQLRPNEVVQKIATGNSVQFNVDTDSVAGVQHVYIKPTVSNTRTNFIINTDQRSYRLIVNSTGETEYVVIWQYPHEDEQDRLAAIEAEQQEAMASNARFNELLNGQFFNNYTVTKNKNVKDIYIPHSVFNDGTKTYIEVTEANKDNMPTVYSFDEWNKSKLQLVNYRMKGKFLEIDKVMHNMKLVYSQDSYLIITDNQKHEVPSPRNISFDPINVTDLFNQTEQQAPIVEYQDTWIPLKERMRKAQTAEIKQFINETRQQEEQSFNDTLLEQQIAELEAELGIARQDISNANNQSDEDKNANEIHSEIAEIYRVGG